MSENYEKMRRPPTDALKQIGGGSLKNFTDIAPQWRYEKMDEVFGACGTGWKFEITKLWTEIAPDGQVMSFATVNVYTCTAGKWSDPIPGIGGSMIVEKDKNGVHPNDEGFKMAVTDALSVALKMLGMGADIYRGLWDGTKYKDAPTGKEFDLKEYGTLKASLIDWLGVEPILLNTVQRDWVNKMITDQNIVGMKNAIDLFKKASEKARKAE